MRHLRTDHRDHEDLARASRDWPSWTLTPGQRGDLALILDGAYAPLDGFMTQADAGSCAREMRLADGTPFPAPVVLGVTKACADEAAAAGHLVLRDAEGVAVATLDVQDVWSDTGQHIGGPVTALRRSDAGDGGASEPGAHRPTPAAVTDSIRQRGWQRTVAFATRGVVHRAEHDATRAAMDVAPAGGLVLIGLSDPGEDDRARLARVRCHEAAMRRYPDGRALLWLVPLPRRSDPVEDVLLAAVVARNAGCTDLVITEPLDADARRTVSELTRRLNLRVTHTAIDRAAEQHSLAEGERLPDSYTFPEVAEELAALHPPKHRRGLTVFFTGLSGSGKSTIANMVRLQLLERTRRPVTLLDGDLVRQHLSSELGFSREHRDLNIRRIAFVASEITKHGGIALCAPIAPYDSVRKEARQAIEAVGGFVLVFVDTPLDVCEARDRKGLYAKARAGLIREFTGVSDPYEPPADAELVVRTADESAEDAASRILEYLAHHGYLIPGGAQWAR